MSYLIKIIDKNQIGLIKPLWEELNTMHLKNSHYFKKHFEEMTFEKRCEKFNEIDNNIHIEILIDENSTFIVGYCISSIEKNIGEIDSIFIEEHHRKYGYGEKLVENSIKWLKKKNCSEIIVAVGGGNESVFKFYEKFDFYPRTTYLQLK